MTLTVLAVGVATCALGIAVLTVAVFRQKPKPASILSATQHGVSPELVWLAYALECQPAEAACQVLGVVFTEEQNFKARVSEAKEQADERLEDERYEHLIFVKKSTKERYDLAAQVRDLKKEATGLRDRLRRALPDDDVTEGVPEPVAEPTSLG